MAWKPFAAGVLALSCVCFAATCIGAILSCNCEQEEADVLAAEDARDSAKVVLDNASAALINCTQDCEDEEQDYFDAVDVYEGAQAALVNALQALAECEMYGGSEFEPEDDGLHSILVKSH